MRVAKLLVAAGLTLTVTAGAAGATSRVSPYQHFVGLVNGWTANAGIRVACPGPAMVGRTAGVLSGQTMSVTKKPSGHGYTGLFNHIYAWFVPATGTTSPPTMLTFTEYATPQAIPSSIQVPCGGSGQVEFSSCPYLAPCAAGWSPEFVSVAFENVAV
jgi:hypothetical protein